MGQASGQRSIKESMLIEEPDHIGGIWIMNRKILINGKIYTEDKRNPWAEAVAIEGKHFAHVGTSKEVLAYAE